MGNNSTNHSDHHFLSHIRMAGMHRKSIEAADTLRSDNEEGDDSSHGSDNGQSSPSGKGHHQHNQHNSNLISDSGHQVNNYHRGQDDHGDSSMDGSFSESSRSPITSDMNPKNKVTKKSGKGSNNKKSKNATINNRSPSPASSRYSVDSIVHGAAGQVTGHGNNGQQQQQPREDHRAHSIAALRARAMEHSAKVLQSLDHGPPGAHQLTESQAQALFYHRHHHGHHPPPPTGSSPSPSSANVQVSPYSFQINHNNPTVRPIY